jgi:hypothetical protein
MVLSLRQVLGLTVALDGATSLLVVSYVARQDVLNNMIIVDGDFSFVGILIWFCTTFALLLLPCLGIACAVAWLANFLGRYRARS